MIEETVDITTADGQMETFVCHPERRGPFPAVFFLMDAYGMREELRDMTRRLATVGYYVLLPNLYYRAGRLGTQNFIAFAPDGLTSVGGYPNDEDKARELFQQVDREKMTQDFEAAARWLKARADCTGKLGVVGFCFGGGIANTLAVRLGADLAAAVPFHGSQPSAAETAKIQAPLLIHYAALDERINAGWPAYEKALRENHKPYAAYIYEGTNHGFHNDTTPRYDEAAAKLAWQRMLDFFNKNLRG